MAVRPQTIFYQPLIGRTAVRPYTRNLGQPTFETVFLLLSFHLRGCRQHRLDNPLIAGAPAHVPGKTHSDFFFGGIGVSLQKFTGAQEKSWSAKSTLKAVIFPEAFLQG